MSDVESTLTFDELVDALRRYEGRDVCLPILARAGTKSRLEVVGKLTELPTAGGSPVYRVGGGAYLFLSAEEFVDAQLSTYDDGDLFAIQIRLKHDGIVLGAREMFATALSDERSPRYELNS